MTVHRYLYTLKVPCLSYPSSLDLGHFLSATISKLPELYNSISRVGLECGHDSLIMTPLSLAASSGQGLQ